MGKFLRWSVVIFSTVNEYSVLSFTKRSPAWLLVAKSVACQSPRVLSGEALGSLTILGLIVWYLLNSLSNDLVH